jgi:hypothetical protein
MGIKESLIGLVTLPLLIAALPIIFILMMIFYVGAISYDMSTGILKTLGLMETEDWECMP